LLPRVAAVKSSRNVCDLKLDWPRFFAAEKICAAVREKRGGVFCDEKFSQPWAGGSGAARP
jgi:hypothetical protein